MDSKFKDLAGYPGIIVASTGGHLEQAIRRSQQFGIEKSATFVTFANAQSLSLALKCKVITIPRIESRDWWGVLVASWKLLRIIKKNDCKYILSTGSAIALACIPVSLLKKIRFLYIESIAREKKPSLTGFLLQFFRNVELYTESEMFKSKKWTRISSIFNEYAVLQKGTTPKKQNSNLNIFATVGTLDSYPFPRMLTQIQSVLQEGDSITWQIGNMIQIGLPGKVFSQISNHEFRQHILNCDVVISHAGVGSILTILDLGKIPILMVRDPNLGEHIDSHQKEIAFKIARKGLAILGEPFLERAHLIEASMLEVVDKSTPNS